MYLSALTTCPDSANWRLSAKQSPPSPKKVKVFGDVGMACRLRRSPSR